MAGSLVMEIISRLDGSPSSKNASTQGNWDLRQTLHRLGGDEKLLYEVLDIFIAQAPQHVDTLRRALAQGDAEAVQRTAHSMKGELGYLGMVKVLEHARKLEELGRKSELEEAARVFVCFEPEIAAIVEAMCRAKSVAAPQGALETVPEAGR
jgi:HPt (histidine-containing phosphotransfer) domain-containing protein